MSRISKEVAKNIATKMTSKSYELFQKLEKDFKDTVRSEYLKQVPEQVLTLFKTHSGYVETSTQVFLNGKGFNNMYVSISPCAPAERSYPPLEMTVKVADKLIAMKRKYEDAKAKHNSLKNEVEGTLISLGTHARIRESLPEAAEFLPPPMSNALIVDVTGLQKRLKAQTKIEKEAV